MEISDPRAISVLFVGYFFQSLGFFMTIFYYVLRYSFVLARCSSAGAD